MKINTILEFEKIYTSLEDKKIPLKLSYNLIKIHRKAQEDIQFYQTKMSSIITEYGERDESGEIKPADENGFIPIKKDKLDECQSQINELENLEFDGYEDFKIDLSLLDEFDEFLTLKDLEVLINFQ